MGVLPSTWSELAWNDSADTKSCTTLTGPNVTTAISTRLDAKASPESSFWSCFRPVLSSAMGRPDMEPETSSTSTHGQRGSGLSTKETSAKGTWVSCDIKENLGVCGELGLAHDRWWRSAERVEKDGRSTLQGVWSERPMRHVRCGAACTRVRYTCITPWLG